MDTLPYAECRNARFAEATAARIEPPTRRPKRLGWRRTRNIRSRGSVVRIAGNAVASPEGHVQHVREDLAPDAVHGLLQKGESLAPALDDGRDQPAPRRELLNQGWRDVGAGGRDADPVVWGVLGVREPPVAVNENHVGVARPFDVLPGEGERCRVDVDGHDQTLATHHLPRQGCAV